MTQEGVENGKYEVCLDYHIHRCKAPCVGRQTHDEYVRNIAACCDILKGNTVKVAQAMKEEMQNLAAELRFEEAQAVKEKYDLIENFRARSEVVPGLRQDLDVFNIISEENVAFINFLHVTEGCINQAFTFEYKKKLDESDEELLRLGIIEMRGRGLGVAAPKGRAL